MKMDCCVVRDLLPLYIEDMVSQQTAEYIRQHLAECPDCQKEYKELGGAEEVNRSVVVTETEGEPFLRMMRRVNRQVHSLAYGVIVFFVLWGFSLTGGADLMYNSVIMPVVGVFGYYVFQWKALYKMPLLLLVVNLVAYRLHFVQIDVISVIPWTMIYSVFVVAGVLVAFLLHIAFRKERTE